MSLEELDAEDLTHWDRKTYFEPRSGFSFGEFHHILHDAASFLRSQPKGAEWAA